jgi:hypothetical protein
MNPANKGMGKQFWPGNLLESEHFEDPEKMGS